MNQTLHWYYFKLQFFRLFRWVKAQGFPLVLFIALVIGAYAGAFYLPFYGSGGPKILLSIELYLLYFMLQSITQKRLNVLLQMKQISELKVGLSLAAAVVLLIPLLVAGLYDYALVLVGFAFVLPWFKQSKFALKWSYTPFSYQPFEFTAGIRKTFFLQIVLLGLFAIGVKVNNMNLAFAAIGFNLLSSFLFYVQPEPLPLLRLSNFSPARFLWWKLKIGMLHALIYNSLFTVLGFLFYSDYYLELIGILGIGLVYLSVLILAKYAAFPKEISIPQALVFALGFWVPPIMLLVGVYFYHQAKQNLKFYLPA